MNRDGARALLEVAPLAQVLALLNGDGEEARVVGGAVRNALAGRPVHDFDITTTAEPPVVVSRATAAGLRAIPTGIAHGTVTLLVDGRPFEVTTLREDVATDGRHATIRFGRDFESDALRRDFTINALSMGIDGRVYDYTRGLDDLAAGRVRFIGDADTRIREDFLRILRFFRFAADYAEGEFDADGVAASIRERAGLERLSRERVHQELMKLLAARHAVKAVTAMSEAGLLGPLLRSVPRLARLARVVAIDPDADAVLRLAAIAVAVTEDAATLRDALRLSNAEAARSEQAASGLAALHGLVESPPRDRLRALLFERGRNGAVDAFILAWADSAAPAGDDDWRAALDFLREASEPHFPFSGADLSARGVPTGKPLGEALKRLQANWIAAGLPDDPDRLARLVAEATKS